MRNGHWSTDLFTKLAKIILLTLLSVQATWAQNNYLESSSEGVKVKVGVVRLRSNGIDESVSQKTQSVLEFDLKIDGRFVLINDDKISKLWMNQGVNYFIHGKLQKADEEKYQLELNLSDVFSGDLLMGKLYTVNLNEMRKAVHDFSEAVIAQIYGEAGVATTRLLFVKRSKGVKNLFVMDYDGANVERITSGPTTKTFPEWGFNGESVFYTSFGENGTNLKEIRLNDGKARFIYNGKMQAMLPRLSPDGSTLAFVGVKNRNTDIYTMNLKSKEILRLTQSRKAETSPEWFVGGKELLYSMERGGGPQIYKMNLEKNEANRVTFHGRYNESVSVSPLGDKIAYCSMTEGRLNLYTMDLFTGAILQLTANQGDNESPTWSPDGRILAFSSTRSGTSQVYLMRANGTSVKQITSSGENKMPRWSKKWNNKGK